MLYQGKNYQTEQRNDHNLKRIFDQSPIGIAILDENGCFEDANPAFIEHVGRQGCEVVHQHHSNIFEDKALEKFQILIDIVKKSGQRHTKDVISMKGCEGQQKIFEISLAEFSDRKDQSTKMMVFTEDITHQQNTHLALLQSEKLALTGRLAASLAHEINNPLQVSLGCLGLVEEMLEENDGRELKEYINLAIEELQRSARIVKKLRDLNRSSDQSERSPINVHDIIEGALVLTKNHLRDKEIVPIFLYQGPPPIIKVVKDEIQQVILNLLMNAIDELPKGGKIYIDLINSENPKGIKIKIKDTGNGIDPKIADKIFDPFFTTKGEGIGLGLFISKQIIENHSGTLEFSSKRGEGTEFLIFLPDL